MLKFFNYNFVAFSHYESTLEWGHYLKLKHILHVMSFVVLLAYVTYLSLCVLLRVGHLTAIEGGTSNSLNAHLQDGSLQNSCDMCIS
jgi:hypothetical protein